MLYYFPVIFLVVGIVFELISEIKPTFCMRPQEEDLERSLTKRNLEPSV